MTDPEPDDPAVDTEGVGDGDQLALVDPVTVTVTGPDRGGQHL